MGADEDKRRLVGHIEIDFYSDGTLVINAPKDKILTYGMLGMVNEALTKQQEPSQILKPTFSLKPVA